jgi:hypothetical protein
MTNEERDDIKALVKIIKNLDGNVAGIERLMREIKEQIEGIASYIEELRQPHER